MENLARNKGGRPTKPIDLEIVRRLAAIQCSEREICSVLGMSPRSFQTKKLLDGRIQDAINAGKSLGSVSIKRQQFKQMMRGNSNITIWLGKIYANQRDPASMPVRQPIQAENPGLKIISDIFHRGEAQRLAATAPARPRNLQRSS